MDSARSYHRNAALNWSLDLAALTTELGNFLQYRRGSKCRQPPPRPSPRTWQDVRELGPLVQVVEGSKNRCDIAADDPICFRRKIRI